MEASLSRGNLEKCKKFFLGEQVRRMPGRNLKKRRGFYKNYLPLAKIYNAIFLGAKNDKSKSLFRAVSTDFTQFARR